MAIYFIQDTTLKFIKIGFVQKHTSVQDRLINLQVGNPSPLVALAVATGTYEQEQQLHSYFAEYHKSGEWFEPHERLLDFIRQIKSGKPIEELVGGEIVKMDLRNVDGGLFKVVKKHKGASDLGKIGGPARAKMLTPERRSEIARMGAEAMHRNRYGLKEDKETGFDFNQKQGDGDE